MCKKQIDWKVSFEKSFNNDGKHVLKNAAKNEEKIDYNDLKYDIIDDKLGDYKIFRVEFLRFGTLYDFLEKLMIGEINIRSLKVKEIDLTILFFGYNKNRDNKNKMMFGKICFYKKQKYFCNTKNFNIGKKDFLAKRFNKKVKEKSIILLSVMRQKIISAFKKKVLSPLNFQTMQQIY